MKRIFLLLFIQTLLSVSALAQVDTIYRLNPASIKKYLKEGAHQYLVFIQSRSNPQKTTTWIWSRQIKFSKKKSEDLIEIEQKWYASDTTRNRYLYSQVRANDFSPVYHYTKSTKGIDAFDFYENKIVGSDSITDNSKKDFNLKLTKPLLNWELDMETFPLLDLKEGKRFFISFYHPSGPEPKLYEYKVVGDENIKTIEGASVLCWKLRIDYNEKSWAIFYISKKGRELLKMEEDFGTGTRCKVRLSNSIPVR
jgi:hypothetical protein